MARTPARRRSNDGFGSPIGHRTIHSLLIEIAAIEDRDERVAALKAAPRPVRDICIFAYGTHAIALPKGPLSVTPINPRAFADEAGYPVDFDLLAGEAHKLVRIWSREVIPHMDPKKRLQLWYDLINRLPADECATLEYIRQHRALPWRTISRGVVASAFPGLLEMEVTAERPPEDISYMPSAFTGDPAPIHDAPKPAPSREMTPEERNYARLMRDLGFV